MHPILPLYSETTTPPHPIAPKAPAKPRTCDELGVCQRSPTCQVECFTFPFAPGVIERREPPTFNWRGLLEAVAVLAVMCGAVGLTLGLAAGWGGL